MLARCHEHEIEVQVFVVEMDYMFSFMSCLEYL